MSLFRPKDLNAFLAGIDEHAKKSLSQNFLVDGNILKKTLRIAKVHPGDRVLEIGPGPGALTEAILHAGATVYAVEKDAAFARALERLQTTDQRLHTFQGDILTFPLDTLPKNMLVIANIPYQITSPLLGALFAHAAHWKSLTLMVQKEVAIRICAEKGKLASSLSLFCQYYAMPSLEATVSASCFQPKPKIDSAIVHFVMRKERPLKDPAPFFAMIKKAYQQRRKMLRASLKIDGVEKALTAMGKNPLSRPENLTLQEHLLLFSLLYTINREPPR